jgi:hypothetical protein
MIMFLSSANTARLINAFKIQDRCLNYREFAPRLYNYCQSLGFEAGKIMPSTAFCADESQGYPTLIMNKHFGTFPFNHGRVGGIVATDRHQPYADHGRDLLILQASHVGYDTGTGKFGALKRLYTEGRKCSPACGKIANVLQWYIDEHEFARSHVYLEFVDNTPVVTIDNQLLNDERVEGLFINLHRMTAADSEDRFAPAALHVTGQSFAASSQLLETLGRDAWKTGQRVEIGHHLLPELFYFKRQIYPTLESQQEGGHRLEENLIIAMPWILTSPEPMLAAAKINTQVEFDRAFRMVAREPAYAGKRLLLISGINIDISPGEASEANQMPVVKFVPWAAYYQDMDHSHFSLEQDALYQALCQQSSENPNQLNLDAAVDRCDDAVRVSESPE